MTLIFALILDALFGEPGWLWSRVPHPAVMMGRLIGDLDKRLNDGDSRRTKGIALVVLIATLSIITGKLLALVPGPWVEIAFGAILLAHKSLATHVTKVADALILGVDRARAEVAKIVGRDTSALDEPAIARAAIESAAENFSDGLVAPAMWFALFGLPGLLTYKMVNTADSMIGYRNEQYQDFGWAAARLDDVLNWVPARLTALLILAQSRQPGLWSRVRRDAPLHRSPNAGWPEAAMAACLGLSLAGPRSYDGQMRDFPFVNPEGRRAIDAGDIRASVLILWRSWALLLVIALLLWLV